MDRATKERRDECRARYLKGWEKGTHIERSLSRDGELVDVDHSALLRTGDRQRRRSAVGKRQLGRKVNRLGGAHAATSLIELMVPVHLLSTTTAEERVERARTETAMEASMPGEMRPEWEKEGAWVDRARAGKER